MSTPSGFSDGTRMTTVFRRIDRASSSSNVASLYASVSGVRMPPTSVEWMLDVTRTTTLPSRSSAARSGAVARRGSASLRCASRTFGKLASVAESPMNAAMNGRPSVVLPRTRSCTLGDAASSALNQATTCCHSGSLRSVPGSKPMTEAGVGTARDWARAAGVSRRANAQATATERTCMGKLWVKMV